MQGEIISLSLSLSLSIYLSICLIHLLTNNHLPNRSDYDDLKGRVLGSKAVNDAIGFEAQKMVSRCVIIVVCWC